MVNWVRLEKALESVVFFSLSFTHRNLKFRNHYYAPSLGTIMETKYIIALALLSILFISSEITLADSAWVLWVEDRHYPASKSQTWGTHTNKWSIVDASSSEKECHLKIQEKIINCILNTENLLKNEDVFYKVNKDTITFLFFDKDVKPDDKVKHMQVLHYLCLPGTVDPRNQHSEK